MNALRPLAIVTFALGLNILPGCGILGIGGGGGDDIETDLEEGETRSDENAPVFLDFSVNTSVATDVDQLRFTAVLTDPDGIDDLIGGALKSQDGASYGAFQTSSSEGAYELSLSWDDLNTVQPVDVEDDMETRTFVAEFFDAGGNVASQTITVSLTCDGDMEGTCDGDGRCMSLMTGSNCLECGNDCSDTSGLDYRDGYVYSGPACDSGGAGCFAGVAEWDGGRSCDDVCGSWSCITAWRDDDEVSCGTTPSGADEVSMSCVCVR